MIRTSDSMENELIVAIQLTKQSVCASYLNQKTMQLQINILSEVDPVLAVIGIVPSRAPSCWSLLSMPFPGTSI